MSLTEKPVQRNTKFLFFLKRKDVCGFRFRTEVHRYTEKVLRLFRTLRWLLLNRKRDISVTKGVKGSKVPYIPICIYTWITGSFRTESYMGRLCQQIQVVSVKFSQVSSWHTLTRFHLCPSLNWEVEINDKKIVDLSFHLINLPWVTSIDF